MRKKFPDEFKAKVARAVTILCYHLQIQWVASEE